MEESKIVTEPEKWVTLEGAAKRLSVSTDTSRHGSAKKQFPVTAHGNSVSSKYPR
jgi:hypothetical protein